MSEYTEKIEIKNKDELIKKLLEYINSPDSITKCNCRKHCEHDRRFYINYLKNKKIQLKIIDYEDENYDNEDDEYITNS